MSELNLSLEKVHPAELRAFAVGKSREHQTVLIELDLPARQADLRRTADGDGGRYTPVQIRPQTPEQQKEVEKKTAEARKFLKLVLGEEPELLRAAHAFIVKVDGEQLERIAQSPLIKAIRPNRQLTVRMSR